MEERDMKIWEDVTYPFEPIWFENLEMMVREILAETPIFYKLNDEYLNSKKVIRWTGNRL